MRPRSMTGFGRGEAEEGGRSWTVEIRTVNHRFLDQRVVLPPALTGLEERVKKTVAGQLDRGRVELFVLCRGNLAAAPLLAVDLDLARQYHSCLVQLNEQLGLGCHVSLSDLLAQRGIIVQQEQNPDIEQEWPLIEKAVLVALADCDRMREQEGQALKTELNSRLDAFAATVREVEVAMPQLVAQRHQELKERLTKLLAGVDIDPARLAQEAAIMADKADVTEEVVRLTSHISQFRSFLDSEEPSGRRLDFLLQEFLREVNTLASKISNAAIARLGVEMKNEIEKLREQVQNIE
ncbi:MAG: TIGR00255 family protein [Candidatus Electronema aureum]|uniref:TIGR00255 family protein n=1 Tax=Candidatus Electronema aureum TaxID=2005002 RepID=A0A521G0K7_9BACT|nr:MAG: TIGR00255 family protein [Candidatus Electronema aureum]